MLTSVASTECHDSQAAARELADKLQSELHGAPKAIVVFAGPSHDHRALLGGLTSACRDSLIVGASSAGEFMDGDRGEGLACALAITGVDVEFRVGVGRNLGADPVGAARDVISSFGGMSAGYHGHRSALILADALAGHTDALVDELTIGTAGNYQFFGGGAGDNAQFRRTSVFHGREVLDDAVVALEILSEKPIGIGVKHGWTPASKPLRVTETEGSRVISFNGFPAVEAIEAHAQATNQSIDRNAPITFFLHNILGIETSSGHRLRVPLAVLDDGSVQCAAPIPTGSIVYIMKSSHHSAVEAASIATEAALAALGPHKPGVGLFFDCVATRLRMGASFGDEIATVRERLGGASLVGCNTHGQIARAEGQFQGFHNCTAVVCVLPE